MDTELWIQRPVPRVVTGGDDVWVLVDAEPDDEHMLRLLLDDEASDIPPLVCRGVLGSDRLVIGGPTTREDEEWAELLGEQTRGHA